MSRRQQSQKGKRPANELPPYEHRQRVPKPDQVHATSDGWVGSSSRALSKQKREALTLEMARERVRKFKLFADKYRLPFSHEDLKNANRHTNQNLEHFDKIVQEHLGPSVPSRPFSGQYYDNEDKPLFFYFGYRRRSDMTEKDFVDLGINGDYSAQYQGRTLNDLEKISPDELIFDGIGDGLLNAYHEATQRLCSFVQPIVKGRDPRHEWEDTDANPRINRYQDHFTGEEIEERRGVTHLVQGWIQQAQPEKGLFLSSPFVQSAEGLGAIQAYYYATSTVSAILGIMFSEVFPKTYKTYEKAFKAGVWVQGDPGPWLGRAIIYKLQGKIHIDQQDVGPAACIPCGHYLNGEMCVPQFLAKFTYRPGHVCLFESGDIWHKVATYQWPLYNSSETHLQPGRISTVYFMPQTTLEMLIDKPEGWGRYTNYGKSGNMNDLM